MKSIYILMVYLSLTIIIASEYLKKAISFKHNLFVYLLAALAIIDFIQEAFYIGFKDDWKNKITGLIITSIIAPITIWIGGLPLLNELNECLIHHLIPGFILYSTFGGLLISINKYLRINICRDLTFKNEIRFIIFSFTIFLILNYVTYIEYLNIFITYHPVCTIK